MANNGAILWEGRSLFDHRPIAVIATGLTLSSKNTKTGAMIQTWILPRWRNPLTAVKVGSDGSICGSCALRGDACYVAVERAPLSVWKAYRRGIYPRLSYGGLAGRIVRLGSYGDPAAVPFDVWASFLVGTVSHTGYTHAWRDCDQRLARILMASADTPEDRELARSRGWRVFRSRFKSEELLQGEISCPASEEAGHRTTCAECGLCDGSRDGDKRRDIAIIAHGPINKVRGYERARERLRVIA